jgi:hypothetical protein
MLPLLASTLVQPTLPADCDPASDTVWAERVVAFDPGPGVEPAWADPETALGAPDFDEGTGAVSLGNRGGDGAAELVVAFASALLVDGPGPDLTVIEAGPSPERTEVAVSTDGETWHVVGTLAGARSLDLSGKVPVGARFTHVRLRTADPEPASGPWAGPDIDAVGLLHACGAPRIRS